jgi:hypothetical protein
MSCGYIDHRMYGDIKLERRLGRLIFRRGELEITLSPEQEAEFWKQVREVAPYNIYATKSTKANT